MLRNGADHQHQHHVATTTATTTPTDVRASAARTTDPTRHLGAEHGRVHRRAAAREQHVLDLVHPLGLAVEPTEEDAVLREPPAEAERAPDRLGLLVALAQRPVRVRVGLEPQLRPTARQTVSSRAASFRVVARSVVVTAPARRVRRG